jgi:hypothetical protein
MSRDGASRHIQLIKFSVSGSWINSWSRHLIDLEIASASVSCANEFCAADQPYVGGCDDKTCGD